MFFNKLYLNYLKMSIRMKIESKKGKQIKTTLFNTSHNLTSNLVLTTSILKCLGIRTLMSVLFAILEIKIKY